jgi:23S rRNA pseudouridine1911/1915/1917 synthase
MSEKKKPSNSSLTVSAEEAKRIDLYLVGKFPDWSRTRLQKLIDDGHVQVDGTKTNSHLKLRAGQEITIEWPQPKPVTAPPRSNTKVPVLFEDKDVIVLNKPAGLVVHPAVGHNDGNTLMDILQPKLADGVVWPDPDRPGLVHRLDRDTSGVIVMAKNPAAQADISKQFSQRQVKKMYLGLVRGQVPAAEGSLESNLSRHPSLRQRYAVTARGRWALTKFKVREHYGEEATLLEFYPLTGRTHQIRVQISSYGHPILGDHVYGRLEKEFAFIKRHLLHAAQLSFTHPRTKKMETFSAPLPDDFQEAIKVIRLNA